MVHDLAQDGAHEGVFAHRALHRHLVEVDERRDAVRHDGRLLRLDRLLHADLRSQDAFAQSATTVLLAKSCAPTRTDLERPPAPLKVLVEQLLDAIAVGPKQLGALDARLDPAMPAEGMHLADPARALLVLLGPEQALEELALARHGLVQPREHVADIPDRVVCVQLDRTGETVWPAAREGVEEEVED